MFTGIVTHIGSVRRVHDTSGGVRMEIESDLPVTALETGASVAHDGCCLTIVAAGETNTGRRWHALETGASVAHDGCCLTIVAAGETDAGRRWHALDVSRETLSRTTLGMWREGQAVNLEAAARFGDPIGGHHVLGHVDGCGIVETVEHRGDNLFLEIDAPESLAPFIAEKGSIAVDGVSLTVNGIEGARFALNIIPHTGKVTTLGGFHPGRRVNLEIDPLARYVARLLSSGHIT